MADDSLSSECDVLVIGSGAAGMTAALTAARNGARVILAERAPTVGGTSAVSGGIAWIPAHDKVVDDPLPVEDALVYLDSLSNGTMDADLIRTFVVSGQTMIDFLEAASDWRAEPAAGFPDYKPEHPGGRAAGGRSLSPLPYDTRALGEWAERLTTFPKDFSNVGFDAETRARLSAAALDVENTVVAGQALIARLLAGVLDAGVDIRTGWRGRTLLQDGGRVVGARFDVGAGQREIRAAAGVVLASGGFEWDAELVTAFLRGPMRGPVSPPYNTGDALRMAQGVGAALGTMQEAWWVPVIKIPGDVHDGWPRSRSVRLERTRPRSIIVNADGERFVNEAADYNSMVAAFQYLDVRTFTYRNNPGWIVFDQKHLDSYGFLGVEAGGEPLEWFHGSATLAELAATCGIDAAGLAATVERWNAHVAGLEDPDFGRGSGAYDGYWGDQTADTVAGRTLGPIDTAPFYAVPIEAGAMGTKGGPRTDADARVIHTDGHVIDGLYAAGNAMASVMGMAYGGAGGTLGPGMVFGFRAGHHAATGRSVS
ncbi:MULTISPECIES: FAD-dependent oxidoreductase [unclassified Microbacterium]|uniref:FAD-dependent oxidoreductase n=1 Tax=unclassified Microbacterium TaxID=2609290 RepID=UPI00301B4FC1